MRFLPVHPTLETIACWFCGDRVIAMKEHHAVEGDPRCTGRKTPAHYLADAACVECRARYVAWCKGDGAILAISFRSLEAEPTTKDWPRAWTEKRASAVGRVSHVCWDWFEHQNMSREAFAEMVAGRRRVEAAIESVAAPSEQDRDVAPGSVAMHLDRGKQHLAIILETAGREAFALFLTSNPRWSKGSRPATREELALAGVHHSRQTYLAPAIRLSVEFERLHTVDFPEHRIESLRSEFPRWRELL